MSLEIIGADAVTAQGTRKSWSYLQGEIQTLIARGPSAKTEEYYQLLKTVAAFSPTYDTVEHDPGRGVGTVIATIVEDAQTVYEMLANEVMKPLEQSAYYALGASPLTAKQILEANEKFAEGVWPENTGFSDKQQEYYLDLCVGLAEIPEIAYVLRETKTVSKRSQAALSYDGVLTVVSLPDVSAINTLINIAGITTGEWLKKAPTCRTNGRRKWDLQQEWWWANKWHSKHYSGGSWTPA
jgi:hypothetical protein